MERFLSLESTTGNNDVEPPKLDPFNAIGSVVGIGGLAAPRIRQATHPKPKKNHKKITLFLLFY
jgi:hypothetical protein